MGREVFTCSLDPTTNSELRIYDFSFKTDEIVLTKQKNPFWFAQKTRNLHSEFLNSFSKLLIQFTGMHKNVGSLFWSIYVKLNWKVLRGLPFMKNYCSTSKRSFHAHRHLTLWPVYLYLYLKSWRNFRYF